MHRECTCTVDAPYNLFKNVPLFIKEKYLTVNVKKIFIFSCKKAFLWLTFLVSALYNRKCSGQLSLEFVFWLLGT